MKQYLYRDRVDIMIIIETHNYWEFNTNNIRKVVNTFGNSKYITQPRFGYQDKEL